MRRPGQHQLQGLQVLLDLMCYWITHQFADAKQVHLVHAAFVLLIVIKQPFAFFEKRRAHFMTRCVRFEASGSIP